MGSPDFLHFGDRCYQVKCFGKYSQMLVPGSRVKLYRNCQDLSVFGRFEEAQRLQKAYQKRRGYEDPVDRFFQDWEDLEAAKRSDPASNPVEVDVPSSDDLDAPWTPWDKILSELWVRMHEGDQVDVHSYQIITRDGDYIVVLNDHLSHWQATPLHQLPTFSVVGELTDDPSEGASSSEFSEPCEICAVICDTASQP